MRIIRAEVIAFVECRVDAIALRQPIAVPVVGVRESVRTRCTLLPVLINHPTERIQPNVLIPATSRTGAEESEVNVRLWMASSHDCAQPQVIVAFERAIVHGLVM